MLVWPAHFPRWIICPALVLSSMVAFFLFMLVDFTAEGFDSILFHAVPCDPPSGCTDSRVISLALHVWLWIKYIQIWLLNTGFLILVLVQSPLVCFILAYRYSLCLDLHHSSWLAKCVVLWLMWLPHLTLPLHSFKAASVSHLSIAMYKLTQTMWL